MEALSLPPSLIPLSLSLSLSSGRPIVRYELKLTEIGTVADGSLVVVTPHATQLTHSFTNLQQNTIYM